jgi:hypothetical protein
MRAAHRWTRPPPRAVRSRMVRIATHRPRQGGLRIPRAAASGTAAWASVATPVCTGCGRCRPTRLGAAPRWTRLKRQRYRWRPRHAGPRVLDGALPEPQRDHTALVGSDRRRAPRGQTATFVQADITVEAQVEHADTVLGCADISAPSARPWRRWPGTAAWRSTSTATSSSRRTRCRCRQQRCRHNRLRRLGLRARRVRGHDPLLHL